MKKNILAAGLIAILFIALGIFWGNKKFAPTPVENTAVANFLSQSMQDASGQQHPLAQWKGKALLVNFWATWCAPCVDEMPELSALQTEIAPRKIQIIGVGIDSPSNIAQFASKYQISYPLYLGGVNGTELSRQLGNQAGGLPFTVLIGSDGTVKKTYLGRIKINELRTDLSGL
jgi:thiol-disulfide isomerase/thioredoxin